MSACGEIAAEQIRSQRDEAVPGDLAGLVRNLVVHYEEAGDTALRLLADEHLSEQVALFAEEGRQFHHDWCVRVFAPFLAGLTPTVRERRIAQFVAICDVRTWELLRRRAGLGPKQTERALTEMLSPLVERQSP